MKSKVIVTIETYKDSDKQMTELVISLNDVLKIWKELNSEVIKYTIEGEDNI